MRHHFFKSFKRETVGGFKGRVCCCVWWSSIGFRHEQTSSLEYMNLPVTMLCSRSQGKGGGRNYITLCSCNLRKKKIPRHLPLSTGARLREGWLGEPTREQPPTRLYGLTHYCPKATRSRSDTTPLDLSAFAEVQGAFYKRGCAAVATNLRIVVCL